MEVKDLCKYSPMYSEKEWSSNFVDVVFSNELCISVQTDINLTLKVIHSFNQVSNGPEYIYKLQPGWSTRCVKRALPYVKLVITNDSDQDNNILILSVISDKKVKDTAPLPLPVPIPEPVETKIEQLRSKSPFSSMLKKKKPIERESPAPSCKCVKIPEILSRNSLICGDWNRQLKAVPPPLLGQTETQILTFNSNDQFEWVVSRGERIDKNVSWKFD